MKWMRITNYFISDPIVYPDRVHDVLSVCLKAYVQSLPPRCKFNFPCKLALSPCYVRLALVTTALDFLFAYPASSAYVSNSSFIWQVLLRYCSIEPPAIATYWKIR